MDDTISRAAALDALGEEPPVWCDGEDEIAERDQWRRDVAAIKALPSAQPTGTNTVQVEDCISRAAVLDEIHKYMEERDYTIGLLDDNVCGLPSVTPKQPGWIPVTERLPQNGYWLWSANGGEVKKDFYWDGHWELAEEYGYEVLAWMPLPTPYREGGQDGKN